MSPVNIVFIIFSLVSTIISPYLDGGSAEFLPGISHSVCFSVNGSDKKNSILEEGVEKEKGVASSVNNTEKSWITKVMEELPIVVFELSAIAGILFFLSKYVIKKAIDHSFRIEVIRSEKEVERQHENIKLDIELSRKALWEFWDSFSSLGLSVRKYREFESRSTEPNDEERTELLARIYAEISKLETSMFKKRILVPKKICEMSMEVIGQIHTCLSSAVPPDWMDYESLYEKLESEVGLQFLVN